MGKRQIQHGRTKNQVAHDLNSLLKIIQLLEKDVDNKARVIDFLVIACSDYLYELDQLAANGEDQLPEPTRIREALEAMEVNYTALTLKIREEYQAAQLQKMGMPSEEELQNQLEEIAKGEAEEDPIKAVKVVDNDSPLATTAELEAIKEAERELLEGKTTSLDALEKEIAEEDQS